MAKRAAKKKKRKAKPKPKPRKKQAGADLQYEVLCELSHSIPQKLIREFTRTTERPRGYQSKQINEQAQRYGLPFGGETWDLEALLRALFDFLAKISPHYQRWLEGGGDLPGSRETPSLERGRMAKAELAELQLERERGLVIPREDIHEGLLEFAQALRDAADRLQRQHGADAFEILDDAITSGAAAVERVLAERNGKHRG